VDQGGEENGEVKWRSREDCHIPVDSFSRCIFPETPTRDFMTAVLSPYITTTPYHTTSLITAQPSCQVQTTLSLPLHTVLPNRHPPHRPRALSPLSGKTKSRTQSTGKVTSSAYHLHELGLCARLYVRKRRRSLKREGREHTLDGVNDRQGGRAGMIR
jgi:hypothetical protein